MGHYIPVFFFPYPPENLPNHTLDQDWVEETIVELYKQNEMWLATSRKWWHLDALVGISKGLGLEGLEFLLEETLAVLDETRLTPALQTLEIILETIRDPANIPYPVDWDYDWAIERLLDERCKDAFAYAKVMKENDAPADFGFEACVSFYSFVKTLHHVMRLCLEHGQVMIWYIPQP